MAKMYYTEDEATSKLGVTADELTNMVRQQKLRLFKDGERNMFMASEVDALAPAPADEDEVELAPVEDVVSLSGTDEVTTPTKEDTVITAEGISIFDDEDLEIEAADASARTQITPTIEDQIAIEGVGSGSGLLDLTRESDDTSLGEVIDHIDLDETAGGMAAVAPVGGTYGVVPQADMGVMMVAEAEETLDASSGLFGGLIVGCAVLAMLIGAVMLAVSVRAVPGYLSVLKTNIGAALGGAAVLVIIFGVVGMLIGKSVAARQKALQQMGG